MLLFLFIVSVLFLYFDVQDFRKYRKTDPREAKLDLVLAILWMLFIILIIVFH